MSKPFLRLEPCVVLEIVLKDTLVVPREEVVYEAVKRWGAYAPEARSEPLKQLLSFVRFPLMGTLHSFFPFFFFSFFFPFFLKHFFFLDKEYLLNNVLDNETINSSEELLNIVNDSINHNRSSGYSSDEEDPALFGFGSPYPSPPVSLSSSPPSSSPLQR